MFLGFVENHVEVRGCLIVQQTEAGKHPVAAEMVGNHVQRQVGGGKAAEDKYQYLDDVGIADNLHTTQRNEDGKDGDAVHTDREIDIGYGRYGQGAQKQDGREVDHDV